MRQIHELRAAGASWAAICGIVGMDPGDVRAKHYFPTLTVAGHSMPNSARRQMLVDGTAARLQMESDKELERSTAQGRLGWRRLAHAVAVAARLALRVLGRGWRRLAHAVAVAARLALRFAEREQKRARKAARWWAEKPREAVQPISLDALASFDDGTGSEFYDYARTRASVADDPANVLLQDEAAAALRRIVGDMAPEDVQRMTAWDLDRLRTRLADAGLVPLGVQESERVRLRDPQRKAGEFVKQAKGGGGGKRSRKAQQQVTRDHHVREMTQRQKQAHKQRRRARREEADAA